jgi:hypothetical protein
MPPPSLTFFCELDPAPLQTLFGDPSTIETLRALGAGISLGILDLTPERADVVLRLNEAAIPLVAWLLLPREQGYWFNSDNAPQALERYAAFRAWTRQGGLRWTGVGLDIEPDIRRMQRARWGDRTLLLDLGRRALDGQRLRRARQLYWGLVEHVRADGYRAESYQFPFIVDERRAWSSFLQRTAGLVDIPVDREVLMLYSSFFRPLGDAMVWSYAPHAGAVAIGSTGGGVELAEGVPPLSWEEFARDLRLAARWSDEVYVFSLEGCVRQGYLGRLPGFDWEEPAGPDRGALWRVEALRRGLQAGLWLAAHPMALVGAGMLGLYVRRRPRP